MSAPSNWSEALAAIARAAGYEADIQTFGAVHVRRASSPGSLVLLQYPSAGARPRACLSGSVEDIPALVAVLAEMQSTISAASASASEVATVTPRAVPVLHAPCEICGLARQARGVDHPSCVEQKRISDKMENEAAAELMRLELASSTQRLAKRGAR